MQCFTENAGRSPNRGWLQPIWKIKASPAAFSVGCIKFVLLWLDRFSRRKFLFNPHATSHHSQILHDGNVFRSLSHLSLFRSSLALWTTSQEGQINASQLALIQQKTGLADVLTAVKEAEAKNENERNAVDRRFHSISPQVVAKIERFTGVVDTAVQSSMFIPVSSRSDVHYRSRYIRPSLEFYQVYPNSTIPRQTNWSVGTLTASRSFETFTAPTKKHANLSNVSRYV